MATSRRTGTRKRGGGRRGSGGAGSKVVSVIVTVLTIALALGFMRSNGITDFDGALHYFRGVSREAEQVYPKKIKEAIGRSCNFIKDASCLYNHDTQDRIGDINHDGKVDDSDSMEYAKENSVTLPSHDSGGKQNEPAPNNGSDGGNAMLAKLDSLTVAEAKDVSYSRSDYKHWVTVDGACDAREMALKNVGFKTDPKTCRPLPGFDYVDPYTGEVINDPRKLDIDHIYPLAAVNRAGGASWSPERKKQYANDVADVLIPVSASANREKGDKTPAAWMPKNKAYHCQYATKFVNVASKYGLSITSADKQVLKVALQSCTPGK